MGVCFLFFWGGGGGGLLLLLLLVVVVVMVFFFCFVLVWFSFVFFSNVTAYISSSLTKCPHFPTHLEIIV